MLKQTVESPDRRRVLHPGDEHTPVDLGTFRDLVHDHEETQPVAFEVQWTLPESLSFLGHNIILGFGASWRPERLPNAVSTGLGCMLQSFTNSQPSVRNS